jgi:hypothetical protein
MKFVTNKNPTRALPLNPLPTKKQKKNTKERVMLTSREDETFSFLFIFLK